MKAKPAKCPKCGSPKLVPMVMGHPTEEAEVLAERGQIAIGGCCVSEGQPEWCCRACEHEWLDPDYPARRQLERLFTGVGWDEG